jgi:hypothetical protein
VNVKRPVDPDFCEITRCSLLNVSSKSATFHNNN